MLRASALPAFTFALSLLSLTGCGASPVASGVAESKLANQPCQSDADCGELEYCKTPPGACGGSGACATRPSLVIATCVQSGTVYCGCDGTTYANLCQPAIHGVSIDHEGPCSCSVEDANIDGDTLAEQPWADASQSYFYAFTGNGGSPNDSGTFTATFSPPCRRATPSCAIATRQRSGTFTTDGSTLMLSYDDGDSASFNAQSDCNNSIELSGFDFDQSLTLRLTSIINY